MIDKFLEKNIQLSYRWLRRLNRQRESEQDSLYRTELKRFLQSSAELLRGQRVLDVGSGSWNWSKETFSQICEITSFDVVAHENVDVVGDLYHVHESFPDEPAFDVVIATDVFEHVARLPEAFHQVTSVLKPGGLFIASTPFKKNLHGEDYGDYWRVTRQGWEHLLTEAGFQNHSISWLGEELFPIAYFIRATLPQTTPSATDEA